MAPNKRGGRERNEEEEEKEEGEEEDQGNWKDFYRFVGVQFGASKAEIRKAYKKLALQWHPDKNENDEEASKKFQNLQAVYEILSDDSKRREYDSGYTWNRRVADSEEKRKQEASAIRKLRKEREDRLKREEARRKAAFAKEQAKIKLQRERKAKELAAKRRRENEEHLLELMERRKKKNKKKKKKKKEKKSKKRKRDNPKDSSPKIEDGLDGTAHAYAATTVPVCARKGEIQARVILSCGSYRKPSISLSHFVDQADLHHIRSIGLPLAANNRKTQCQANVWNSREGTIDDGSDDTALKLKQWVTTSR
mmetsp:Transcript_7938/g.12644  ORF Transcript_7938/g.12644 Transcript_7938/m.12644 type:complete len:309 (-) Transcript_7938:91-1017(-)